MVGLSRSMMLVAGLVLACVPPVAVAQPSEAETGEPEARRKALNQEQADKARSDVESNRARLEAYNAAVATARVRKTRNDAVYAEAVAQYEHALVAYQAARAEWENTNPACRRNDPVGCPR